MPTVRVLLQRVGDQTAVIGTRGQQVRDAVVVIVIVALVSLAVLVGIQLRAVDNSRTVVPRVLVSIAIAGEERLLLAHTSIHSTEVLKIIRTQQCADVSDEATQYLSLLVSQGSPIKSLSISVLKRQNYWML